MSENSVIMQYFEWDTPPLTLWKQLSKDAGKLADAGIGAIWIPPPYKGSQGLKDRGYGVYDLYDLGEFDQKGTIATRYGTRLELLDAITQAHGNNLGVYADIVLDHRMGADGMESVCAKKCNPKNRLKTLGPEREILAWTRFSFPGRKGKYSDFKWNWRHFTAIDYNAKNHEKGIFKFAGKRWASQVDKENGNFDYLMGACHDLGNPEVKKELIRWGKWFVANTGIDGFRLDAIKHMRFGFYNEWLSQIYGAFDRKFFTVGEYWSRYLAPLKTYLGIMRLPISLFDAPLHYNFAEASQMGPEYDLRQIFKGTLTAHLPDRSVTFVDNHDTQPGQALESWVQDWFRPMAYALILLRKEGRPCIFYGDYYGMASGAAMRSLLPILLKARKLCAHGQQNNYFDHHHIVGWTREGDEKHPGSGIAILFSNHDGGEKRMRVGEAHAGQKYCDITGNIKNMVEIDTDGYGKFCCDAKTISIWANAGRWRNCQ